MLASGMTSCNEMHNYIPQDGVVQHMIKDTRTIGSSYDRFLQSGGFGTLNSREPSTIGSVGLARGVGEMPDPSLADPSVMGRPGSGGSGPDIALNGRIINYGGPIDVASKPGPETMPLPPKCSQWSLREIDNFLKQKKKTANV